MESLSPSQQFELKRSAANRLFFRPYVATPALAVKKEIEL